MLRSLVKVFSFPKFTRLASSWHTPFGLKMVRYFPNPFEDYKAGATAAPNKDELVKQIDEHIRNITKRLQPSKKNVDGGFYVGITGVAYMFYYLSKNPLLSTNKNMYLQKGLEYLAPALQCSAGDKTSFLLGDAGTYALSAVMHKDIDNNTFAEAVQNYQSLYPAYLNPKFLKCGGDEYFVGRAGYIAGALWMNRELKMPIIKYEDLYKLCDIIVANGQDYARRHNSPCPLMYHYYNTEYLGAAHGVSFILQILLTVPGYLEHNKTAANYIKATVDFMCNLQTEDGNWPCCIEEMGLNEHKLVHWCHGAPGTVYLMAKAYLVYKDRKFFDACVRASEVVWAKGLLRKGPGICHGVAGNGYVFLLLYRLSGEDKYLYRAKAFADFMNTQDFLKDARLPDSPESLYEGTAGTVCFMSDLLVPDKAEFPFQDVFSTYG